MVPNRWFSHLLVVALVVICLLIYVWWPAALNASLPPALPPAPPRRQRSTEPKPFPGFLHQLLCEACEQDAAPRPKTPGSPPPVITCTRGRWRTVDTYAHFCPEADGSYHGGRGRGTMRSNGHPGGKPGRQFQCVSWLGYFYAPTGTIFHGKPASPDLIVRVMACLGEGLGLRGTARGGESDANPVLQWLVEAAEPLQAFSDYLLRELHLSQGQLDELYAVLSAVRAGDLRAAEAVEPLSRSPYGGGTAIAPETKLLRCVRGGERTLAMAPAGLHQIAGLLAPGGVPLCLSDG